MIICSLRRKQFCLLVKTSVVEIILLIILVCKATNNIMRPCNLNQPAFSGENHIIDSNKCLTKLPQ